MWDPTKQPFYCLLTYVWEYGVPSKALEPEDSMEEELEESASASSSNGVMTSAVYKKKDRLSTYRQIMAVRAKQEAEKLWFPGQHRVSLRSALARRLTMIRMFTRYTLS